jgi:hypothetical protein
VVLGRTASGHKIYNNVFAAEEALAAKSNPENWRIGTGSIRTPTESITGHVLRPREQPSVSHTTQQR